MSDDPGGHTEILISNRQGAELDEDALADLARETLAGEGVANAELSISFVDEDEMSALHRDFLGEPGPTDVLSFPLDEHAGGVRVLGDVVIAPSVAAANRPGDVDGELRLLLVHGILHLLGYDHEADEERARMWARQERYSGVSSP
jgi:probable rRNA maturation factor